MKTRILLVDDKPDFRGAFAEALKEEGYTVDEASSRIEGQEAWNTDCSYSIVLIDLEMPEEGCGDVPSGVRLIRYIVEDCAQKKLPVSIAAITAHDEHGYLAQVALAGADGWISKSWEPERQLNTVRLLEMLANKGSVFAALRKSLELRNPYTSGHCERVKEFCRHIVAQLPEADGTYRLTRCLAAASVHDIGKLAAPDDILLGTQGMTSEERDVLRPHPRVGAEMMREFSGELSGVADLILLHHRWYTEPQRPQPTDYPDEDLDGNPTPREQDLPLEVRVLTVADSLDAMLSDRSYRPGLPVAIACEEMRKGRGRQFCPHVIDALMRVPQEEIDEVMCIGQCQGDFQLKLSFPERRLTASTLATLLGVLKDVHVAEGSAFSRLAFKKTEIQRNFGTDFVVLTLTGEEKEVREVEKALRKRKQDREALQGRVDTMQEAGEEVPEEMRIAMWRPVPESIDMPGPYQEA